MAFNARTAYASDYQHADDLTDAKYYRADGEYVGLPEPATGQSVKVNRYSVSSGQYQSFSQSMAFQANDIVVALWAGEGQLDQVRPEDYLMFDSERWKVITSEQTGRSFWNVVLRKGVANV